MDGLLFIFDFAGRKLAERLAELEQENAALREAVKANLEQNQSSPAR